MELNERAKGRNRFPLWWLGRLSTIPIAKGLPHRTPCVIFDQVMEINGERNLLWVLVKVIQPGPLFGEIYVGQIFLIPGGDEDPIPLIGPD